jgi:hypothetical protein
MIPSGWWFQTWLDDFPFHIWDVILPIVELNHIYMYIYIYILLHFINLPIDLADFPFH